MPFIEVKPHESNIAQNLVTCTERACQRISRRSSKATSARNKATNSLAELYKKLKLSLNETQRHLQKKIDMNIVQNNFPKNNCHDKTVVFLVKFHVIAVCTIGTAILRVI